MSAAVNAAPSEIALPRSPHPHWSPESSIPANEPEVFSTAQRFTQVRYEFDVATGVLWVFMRPWPRPSFLPELLGEMGFVERLIERSGGWIEHGGAMHRIAYIVFASDIPGVWNLGGDLATFARAIRLRDIAVLREYGLLCVRGMHRRHRGFGCDITTIALVQGAALGGGFEGVLCSDIIVAEKQARFGFPELNFNLFPGMGALSFLARRIGLRNAERIVTDAREHTADEMLTAGVIDIAAGDGCGAEVVRQLIAKRQRLANGHRAIAAASRLVNAAVSLDELEAIAYIWAEAALNLTKPNLRTIDWLVRAQDRLVAGAKEGVCV